MRAAGLALLLALAGTASAVGAIPARAAPRGDTCTRFFADGETRFGIPRGLLHAIAMTESGRAGIPWPWALNIAGTPYFPATRREALIMMRNATGTLRPDMAVGCMQIHTRWHGAGFTYGEDAIEPAVNVGYAAAYLRSLRDRHGSWIEAVRHYHAGDEAAQREYLCRVLGWRVRLGFQPRTSGMERQCAAGVTADVSVGEGR